MFPLAPRSLTATVVTVLFGTCLVLSALAATSGVARAQAREQGTNHDLVIKTPVGSLEVHSDQVDPKETSLPVYPGARRVEKKDHESGSVSLNFATESFGLKVVAVAFQSDDASETVLAFYRKELAKHGKVIECPGDIDFELGNDVRAPRCKADTAKTAKDVIELGVGTREHHRIVKVERQAKGCKFALIQIEQRGKSKETL